MSAAPICFSCSSKRCRSSAEMSVSDYMIMADRISMRERAICLHSEDTGGIVTTPEPLSIWDECRGKFLPSNSFSRQIDHLSTATGVGIGLCPIWQGLASRQNAIKDCPSRECLAVCLQYRHAHSDMSQSNFGCVLEGEEEQETLANS